MHNVVKWPFYNIMHERVNTLEELAVILDPLHVTFQSRDDKTKVLIGFTAASKQSPLFIYMQYKVVLPNHDFVITPQHKLSPSVIRDKIIQEKVCSGDTAAHSGRSAKHLGSKVLHHLQDTKRIRKEHYIFDGSAINNMGEEKPVMIVTIVQQIEVQMKSLGTEKILNEPLTIL